MPALRFWLPLGWQHVFPLQFLFAKCRKGTRLIHALAGKERNATTERSNSLPFFAPSGYNARVEFRTGQLPMNLEVIEDDMARVIRAKSGAQRLHMASAMYASARRMLLSHLHAEHADWDERRVQQEAARRLSHGAT